MKKYYPLLLLQNEHVKQEQRSLSVMQTSQQILQLLSVVEERFLPISPSHLDSILSLLYHLHKLILHEMSQMQLRNLFDMHQHLVVEVAKQPTSAVVMKRQLTTIQNQHIKKNSVNIKR